MVLRVLLNYHNIFKTFDYVVVVVVVLLLLSC